jgi:hypothetical protein
LIEAVQAAVAAGAYAELHALEKVPVKKAEKPAKGSIGFEMTFNLHDPHTAAFVNNYTFELIRDVSQASRDAIQQVVLDAVRRGGHPYDQARKIRDVIGLTPQQSQAVTNFMTRLSGDSADLQYAMSRELRDRRFDPTLQRAIDEGVPLDADQIEEMADRYYDRYLTHRAETIARTETLRAANIGQQETWRQAAAEGFLVPEETRRMWLIAEDDRLCAACAEVPDLNPDGVGLEEDFDTSEGALSEPPLHPSCRCTVVLEFVTA